MLNKKGQELSTTAIILIILGIVVLTLLILGFLTGWKSFKNILSPTNVDDIVEQCGTVCGLSQEYNFCSAEKTLRDNEKDLEVKTSCAVLANVLQFQEYGVQDCSTTKCDLSCESISIDNKKGILVSTGTEGKYEVSVLANNLGEGQICIID